MDFPWQKSVRGIFTGMQSRFCRFSMVPGVEEGVQIFHGRRGFSEFLLACRIGFADFPWFQGQNRVCKFSMAVVDFQIFHGSSGRIGRFSLVPDVQRQKRYMQSYKVIFFL